MPEYLYIDTETTGLATDDELLSVSVLDDNNDCLFHSLIKPVRKSQWQDAMKINHITPEMVRSAPSYEQIKEELKDLFRSRAVVAYNMAFDSAYLAEPLSVAGSLHCCMRAFASFRNVWLEEKSSFKFFKLVDAARYCNPDFRFNAHDSLEDCKAARVVWRYLIENKGI